VPGPESLPPRVRELAEAEIRDHPRQIAQVIDYLVVATDVPSDRTPAGHGGPVLLPEDVRIERLDLDLAKRLFDATSLRGENWNPKRQFYAVHAYVRHVWAQGDEGHPDSHWDDQRKIWPTVQLSRLIRDNNTSTEYAVRRIILRGGEEELIPFDGYETHVLYRLYPKVPGWLDDAEVAQLRALLTAYWDDQTLPLRVGRALRRVEVVATERYLEDALPLVVGGFESLVKIARNFAGAQFAQRVAALAAEVKVDISVDECREVYDDRSALVHGGGVDLTVPETLDDFADKFMRLQEALRRVVRRAIEDRAFAEIFAQDASIKARWPTVVTDKGRNTTI
jgi:hypothetical protein